MAVNLNEGMNLFEKILVQLNEEGQSKGQLSLVTSL